MDFGIVLDLLVMACGIYMIYWAIQMKNTKKIPEMLVGKGFQTQSAHDANGFIKVTFPLTLGVGVLLFVGGAVCALELFSEYALFDTLIRLVEVVAIIIYGVLLMRAQKKYIVGEKEDKSGK